MPLPPRAIYRGEGDEIDYLAPVDLLAGEIVVQNELVGVVNHSASAGDRTSLCTQGLFDCPKATGPSTAIAVGTKVYWDATNGVATTDDNSGANKALGKTAAAAGDDDATIPVRLAQ